MTDREKLIELLSECTCIEGYGTDLIEKKADHLLTNGVTFAENATVESKWIPVSERLPAPFETVIVHMPLETPCPTVGWGFVKRNGEWYANYFNRDSDEVTHWMPLPEPPKEDEL